MKTHLLPALLFTALCVQAQDQPTPPAAPTAAQKEMVDWLAATDALWQAAFKRDVADVEEAERARLSQQYLTAVDAALARASSASDLKGALALRDERNRFAETKLLPPQDEAGDAALVKQLRAGFRPQFAKMQGDATLRAKTLHGKYDQVLAAAQAQLTQKQRLDDALLVQKKRDEVTAAWIKPAPIPATPPPAIAKSTPAPATPAPKFGTIPASPDTKSAFDAQLAKLTRTAWTWETPMGKNTIKFAKDGTCVHTRFNGTFEIQSDNTVTIKMPTRNEVLVFDFNKGEFTGYDAVLKQKITGKRLYQR